MIKKIFSSKYKKENDKLKMENYLLDQNRLTIIEESKMIQNDLQQKIKKLENVLWHFEDKVGRKKWVNDLRDRVMMVEKWKYDLIYNESSNKEIDLLKELKDDVKEDKRPILEGIIIRLNLRSQEIEKLKQDLVNQTANNIILKDELNKLKNINL